MRVGPHEIEVQLLGVHFGEEVAAASAVLQLEEFVFFEAMHGLGTRATSATAQPQAVTATEARST